MAEAAPPPPAAALPILFARLPARQLCVAAAVCREWRRAAGAELRRALRLDNEADAGRACRALAALRPPLAAQLEALSLARACLPSCAAWARFLLTLPRAAQEFARGVTDADVAALAGPALRSAHLNGAAAAAAPRMRRCIARATSLTRRRGAVRRPRAATATVGDEAVLALAASCPRLEALRCAPCACHSRYMKHTPRGADANALRATACTGTCA
jgi:hypothetical protein